MSEIIFEVHEDELDGGYIASALGSEVKKDREQALSKNPRISI
jgi:hypothetical protein